MSTCRCSPQGATCPIGTQLFIDSGCGMQLVESPRFLFLSQTEKDEIWKQYQEIVEKYLIHCGYSRRVPRSDALYFERLFDLEILASSGYTRGYK